MIRIIMKGSSMIIGKDEGPAEAVWADGSKHYNHTYVLKSPRLIVISPAKESGRIDANFSEFIGRPDEFDFSHMTDYVSYECQDDDLIKAYMQVVTGLDLSHTGLDNVKRLRMKQ